MWFVRDISQILSMDFTIAWKKIVLWQFSRCTCHVLYCHGIWIFITGMSGKYPMNGVSALVAQNVIASYSLGQWPLTAKRRLEIIIHRFLGIIFCIGAWILLDLSCSIGVFFFFTSKLTTISGLCSTCCKRGKKKGFEALIGQNGVLPLSRVSLAARMTFLRLRPSPVITLIVAGSLSWSVVLLVIFVVVVSDVGVEADAHTALRSRLSVV